MTTPIPVIVASPDPLPVIVVGPPGEVDALPKTTAEQDRQTAGERLALRTIPPQTTEEQDRSSAGQRHINRKWENTQTTIAVSVTCTVHVVCAWAIIYGPQELKLLAFTLLSNAFFLVVGTYFQRTNHTKTGGVGGEYAGTR